MFYARIINRNICSKYRLNLDIVVVNRVTYGIKIFRNFGPKIYNPLQHHVKSGENLEAFKKVNAWNGVSCNCVSDYCNLIVF